jgi:hypothetical protein
MRFHVVLEALQDIRQPAVTMWLTNEDGVRVFSVGAREDGGALSDLEAGERIEFAVETRNRFAAGRYHLGCGVTRGTAGLEILLFQNLATDVVSFGGDVVGIVGIDAAQSLRRGREEAVT